MSELDTMQAIIESVLFAAGDAVSIGRLAKVLDASEKQVLHAVETLKKQYERNNCGIMLAQMGNRVQLCSRPEYAQYIRKATENQRPPSLSHAALEVLSIVAYRQPVTRAFIEQLRGVDSANTVISLTDKGLLAECGRLDVPGRPFLYCTTEAFLRTFSISSLEELPALPELAKEERESPKAGDCI